MARRTRSSTGREDAAGPPGAAGGPASEAGPPPFEAALARLEAIVGELESGELDLEASLARFEEGVALSRRCAGQLAEARQRIDVLVAEDGELRERAFEPEASDEGEDGN